MARRPRRCEPEAVLSRSSKVRRLPDNPTREDRLTFCADLSAGLVPNSGARLALRTRKFTLAFGSGADNSTLPCASASSPPPLSLAFSCNGRRHAPLSLPSICEAPSPAATMRSRPSSAVSEAACGDDSFDSSVKSLLRNFSMSMPLTAATGGCAASVAVALSCGASRSNTARASLRSACSAFLSRLRSSFRRVAPGSGAIASKRARSAGADRLQQRREIAAANWRRISARACRWPWCDQNCRSPPWSRRWPGRTATARATASVGP